MSTRHLFFPKIKFLWMATKMHILGPSLYYSWVYLKLLANSNMDNEYIIYVFDIKMFTGLELKIKEVLRFSKRLSDVLIMRMNIMSHANKLKLYLNFWSGNTSNIATDITILKEMKNASKSFDFNHRLATLNTKSLFSDFSSSTNTTTNKNKLNRINNINKDTCLQMYIAKKLKFLKTCPENMTIMIAIVFRHQPNCEYFTVYFRNHRTPKNASAASYNNVSYHKYQKFYCLYSYIINCISLTFCFHDMEIFKNIFINNF
ncbi:hypothetical protein AGLY_010645 [Aphis glycines]|uniref:Uncharacterized protein n=1 Tax=Aphis glycines TaxID=307491 RepID=A0A6G0TE51_APHGL|nr:hypothetical protein AGLY_010645 [Aphis glycines]